MDFRGNCGLLEQVKAGARPDLRLSWPHTTHNRPRDISRNIGGLWYEFLWVFWAIECCFQQQSWGFIFCDVWPVKFWYYSKGLGLNSWSKRTKSRTLNHQRTPDTLEINQWEPSPKHPPQHQDQAQPKSQQAPMQDTPCHFFRKIGTQPCTLADRLPKTIPNPRTTPNTPLDMALLFGRQDPAPSTRTQA